MAFVIKEHRPGKWRIILAMLVSVWVISGWLAYEYGWQQANHDFDVILSQQELLQKELDDLRDTKSQLLTQASRLQRTAQVDRQAKVELAKEVKNFQDLQAQLREEISFYKSILSPGEGKYGLSIYSLEIMRVKGRLYHYKLVLTQSGKGDNVVAGGVSVVIKGVSQGEEKNLDLEKLRVAESPNLSYKFRYFQELSGSFQLPENYSPRDVTVRLAPQSGKRSKRPVRTFDWQKVEVSIER